MSDIKLLDEFYDFLEDYMRFYSEFLILELDKYQIISKNQFQLLDDFIKKEEIFLLKSRGMEQKKDNYLKNFGGKNLTLKEIIEEIREKEYKDKYFRLYGLLSGVLRDLKEANRVCNYLIELQLHKIETRINKSAHQPADKIYNSKRQKTNKTLNSISKKV